MAGSTAQQGISTTSSSSSMQRRRAQTTLGLAMCLLALHHVHADTVTHQCVPFQPADTLLTFAYNLKEGMPEYHSATQTPAEASL